MKPKTVSLLAVTAVLLLIMLQNTQAVTVHLLFWSIMLPQILLIFLTFSFGLLVGYLAATLKSSARRY
jgi:uncharacterized integral membrane protein